MSSANALPNAASYGQFRLNNVDNVGIPVLGANGYVQATSPTDFAVIGSDTNTSIGSVWTTYTTPVFSDATVTFNWRYSTKDTFSLWDPAGYVIGSGPNAVYTQLSDSQLSSTGSQTLSLSKGQIFGFYVNTTDSTGGAGSLNVSNLSISPVPEPEAYGMMLAGLGLMCFMIRRKNSV
jgi:hypothetical protein